MPETRACRKVASLKKLALSLIYGERATFASTIHLSDKVGLSPRTIAPP
jgi:hypothetical protein